jgi:flavin-binding protein dodecin
MRASSAHDRVGMSEVHHGGGGLADAAATAVKTARGTLRDLRVAEVVRQDVQINDGGAGTYRVKLQVSFKYDAGKSSPVPGLAH